jgi:hypothetical protein
MSQTIFTETPYTPRPNISSPIELSSKKCPTDYKVAFGVAVFVIIALIFFLWWRWYSQKEDLEEGIVSSLNSVIDKDVLTTDAALATLNKAIKDTAECVADKVSVSDALKLNQKYFDNITSCGESNGLNDVAADDTTGETEAYANIRNAMRRRRM